MSTLIVRGFALLVLATAATLHAQVPQFINYQGRVVVGTVTSTAPARSNSPSSMPLAPPRAARRHFAGKHDGHSELCLRQCRRAPARVVQ